jgi:outer membrane protein TolC
MKRSKRSDWRWATAAVGALIVPGGSVSAAVLPELDQTVMSELPKDAQELLKTLPSQRLELDFVVGKAAKVSDSFRIVQSQRLTTEVASLQAQSALDWKPYVKVGATDDQRAPSNPFSTNRIQGNSVALGAQTYFSTGTAFSAELSKGQTELSFENPAIGTIEYGETKATLTVSQSLWQNAFGQGFRAQRDAAAQMAQVAEVVADDSTDDWMIGLIGVYYNAWLAKAQALAADTSLARRERLLSMVQVLASRGTAERPDLLQVQSAVDATRVQADRAAQTVGDVWRSLLTALKLPREWFKIDAKKVPIALDDPMKEALQLCGTEGNIAAPPATNLSVKRARLQMDAASLADQASDSQLNPDLSFTAQLANNAIDNTPDSDQSFSDFMDWSNPAWTVGVQLSMPIGFTAEKAQKLSSTADLIRAEAASQQAQDQHATEWVNKCLDLFRLNRSHAQLEAAYTKQRERAQLEEQRFRIGRSSTYQVIQAGDDATQAELAVRAMEVERRMAAWKVRRQAGLGRAWLEGLAQRFGRSELINR